MADTNNSLLATTQAPSPSGWNTKNISSIELASIAQLGQSAVGSFSAMGQGFAQYYAAKSSNSALAMTEMQVQRFTMPDIVDAAEQAKEQLLKQAMVQQGNIRVQTARSGMVVGQGSYAQAAEQGRANLETETATIDVNAGKQLAAAEIQLGNLRAQQAANERMASAAKISAWAGLAMGVLNVGAGAASFASAGASPAAGAK